MDKLETAAGLFLLLDKADQQKAAELLRQLAMENTKAV